MKKTFRILAIFFLLIPNAVLSVERPDIDQYLYASNFYEKFTCANGADLDREMVYQSEILQYEFIKNRAAFQKIARFHNHLRNSRFFQ